MVTFCRLRGCPLWVIGSRVFWVGGGVGLLWLSAVELLGLYLWDECCCYLTCVGVLFVCCVCVNVVFLRYFGLLCCCVLHYVVVVLHLPVVWCHDACLCCQWDVLLSCGLCGEVLNQVVGVVGLVVNCGWFSLVVQYVVLVCMCDGSR